MKSIILAAASVATLAFAGHAAAAITIGDTLNVQYLYPDFGSAIQDSGDFTYTGPGQSILTQFGISTVTLSDNSVTFAESPGCGDGCFQSGADFNGPVLFDLTNNSAFTGWSVLSDTVGITGAVLTGGEIGANWQGTAVQGQVVIGSAVPEPATWALMLVGFAGLGAGVRARRRATAA